MSAPSKFTTFNCDEIITETPPCIIDGESNVPSLFHSKTSSNELLTGIILAAIVLSSRANLKSLEASFTKPGSTVPSTFNGCGFPSEDLLRIFRKMVRESDTGSMTVSTDSAYNRSPFCFIPRCAASVSLSTTDDHELYEVGKDHGTCPLHGTLCKPGTFTAVPTYNAVMLVPFVGVLAGIGNGLKGIATNASKSTIKVHSLLLCKLISDVLKTNKTRPVKVIIIFFKEWQQNAALNKVLRLIHNTKFSPRELPIVLLFNLWFAYTIHWSNSSTRYEHISKDIFQLFTNKFLELYDELRKKGKRTDLPGTDIVSSELHKLLNDFFSTVSTAESHVYP